MNFYRQNSSSQPVRDWSVLPSLPLSVSGGGKQRQAVSELVINNEKSAMAFISLFQGFEMNTNDKEVILECVYKHSSHNNNNDDDVSDVSDVSGWEGVRYRNDKNKPNSLSTAWRVMEAAIDPLTLVSLIKFSQSKQAFCNRAAENHHPPEDVNHSQASQHEGKGNVWSSQLKKTDDVKSAIAAHYDEVEAKQPISLCI